MITCGLASGNAGVKMRTVSCTSFLPPRWHSLLFCLFQLVKPAQIGAGGGISKAPAAWRCKRGINPNLGSSGEGETTDSGGGNLFGALHIRVLFEILPRFSIPKMIPGSVPQVAAPSHLGTQKLLLLGGSLLLPAMLGLLIGFFW